MAGWCFISILLRLHDSIQWWFVHPRSRFHWGEKKVSNDDNVTFVTNKHVLLQLENKIIEKDMSAAPQHFVIMLLCRPKSTLSSNPETHLYVYELFPKLSVRKIPHFLIFLLQLSWAIPFQSWEWQGRWVQAHGDCQSLFSPVEWFFLLYLKSVHTESGGDKRLQAFTEALNWQTIWHKW